MRLSYVSQMKIMALDHHYSTQIRCKIHSKPLCF